MAEDANVAAAPTTEETPNTIQEAPAEKVEAPQQPEGNFIRLTDEQMKFFNGQGMKSGDEFTGKAFEQYKKYMSNPESQPQPKIEEPQQPVQTQPQDQQMQPQQQQIKGGITPEEFLMQSYFNVLSQQEKYQSISEDIANGNVIKEMREFGIEPMVNGQINNGMVNKFLDMKAKTVPAQPQESSVSSTTPTVEYVPIGDKIETTEDAMAVMRQSMEMRSSGQPDHPKIDEARKFLSKSIYGK